MFWLPIIIVAIVILTVSVWISRLGRRRPASLSDLEVLFDFGPDRYAHLRRILGYDDFDFLRSARYGPPMLRRLRKQRARVMWKTLDHVAGDFDSLISIGTLFAIAPTAQAENFARRLAAQRYRFLKMLLVLRARTLVNYFVLWPFDTVPLAAEILILRSEADRILHLLTPDDLGQLRAHLRAL